MTQESEGSKEQRPPVGKSSDTPKEVKTQDGKDDHRSLGKPADMGRDAFIRTSYTRILCPDVEEYYVKQDFCVNNVKTSFWRSNVYIFIQG